MLNCTGRNCYQGDKMSTDITRIVLSSSEIVRLMIFIAIAIAIP